MCAGKKQQKQETVTVVTASTMQYLTQHPDTHEEGRCSEGLSVVNSCRETPGPIPNPEAKPAHADGTATGRLWESKSPPTPNNKTQQNTTKKRTVYHRPLLFAFYQPSRPVEGLICKAKSTAEGYGGESLGGLTSCHRPTTWQGCPELSMQSRAIELFLLPPHCLSCSSHRFQHRPSRSR